MSVILRDLRRRPEIIPLASLVTGITLFSVYTAVKKLALTPDVNVNPVHPYSWQRHLTYPDQIRRGSAYRDAEGQLRVPVYVPIWNLKHVPE
jgi:hypothetical protein